MSGVRFTPEQLQAIGRGPDGKFRTGPVPPGNAPVQCGKPPVIPGSLAVAERDLQGAFNRWLTTRGYVPLDANRKDPDKSRQLKAIQRWREEGVRPHGWWFRMHDARRSLQMSDNLLFDPYMRRCLPVELKAHNRWQPGQRGMVDLGLWEMESEVEEAKLTVVAWELTWGSYEAQKPTT